MESIHTSLQAKHHLCDHTKVVAVTPLLLPTRQENPVCDYSPPLLPLSLSTQEDPPHLHAAKPGTAPLHLRSKPAPQLPSAAESHQLPSAPVSVLVDTRGGHTGNLWLPFHFFCSWAERLLRGLWGAETGGTSVHTWQTHRLFSHLFLVFPSTFISTSQLPTESAPQTAETLTPDTPAEGCTSTRGCPIVPGPVIYWARCGKINTDLVLSLLPVTFLSWDEQGEAVPGSCISVPESSTAGAPQLSRPQGEEH